MSGDAHLLFTAPFSLDREAMTTTTLLTMPSGELDDSGTFVATDLPLDKIKVGTLTFLDRQAGSLHSVGAIGAFTNSGPLSNITSGLEAFVSDAVKVDGIVFPDGYGAVSVTLTMPDGWAPQDAPQILQAAGKTHRDTLSKVLREGLRPALQQILRRCGATGEVVFPYWNLTYAGSADTTNPGRAVLHDQYRDLIYPDSPQPLRSSSPSKDEFVYTGYAYHLLAASSPESTLEKLKLLLLVLNVSYRRLSDIATNADMALRNLQNNADLDRLAAIERQVRAEHHALVTPTFGFDHHALILRDAILAAWMVPTLLARTSSLMEMLRAEVERHLVDRNARRMRRLSYLVAVLTLMAALEAVVTLVG
jgi:3-dehydroquinate dehydratase